MTKKSITHLMLICVFCLFGQKNKPSSLFDQISNNLSASFESNSQWYLNDTKFGEFEENEHLRTTNFLRLDYEVSENFSAGLQLESYAPENLLNNSRLYDKDLGIATYYVRYRTKKVDLTLGHFYEQFGSGLILTMQLVAFYQPR